jgi:hypothetical protein
MVRLSNDRSSMEAMRPEDRNENREFSLPFEYVKMAPEREDSVYANGR